MGFFDGAIVGFPLGAKVRIIVGQLVVGRIVGYFVGVTVLTEGLKVDGRTVGVLVVGASV